MTEGYAIGLDGTRFPITVGHIYGSSGKNYAIETWVDSINYTGYDNVWEIIPHSDNIAFKGNIYIEGGLDSPIRLKSLVLPSGLTELITNKNLTIEDGITLSEDIVRLLIDCRHRITNLADFINTDSDIAFFT